MSKLVNFVIEVPSSDYCWPPSDGDLENREMCQYLELSGGWARCVLNFDIDSPTEKTAYVLKDPECKALEEYIEED